MFRKTLIPFFLVLFSAKSFSQNKLKTSDGSVATAKSVNAARVDVSVDTSLRVPAAMVGKSKVNPAMAYLSFDFSSVSGTSLAEVTAGHFQFWVFDANMKEVKIANEILKKIGGSMESQMVNLTVKVPFRLKIDNKVYTVRMRWENADKQKWIEITSKH